MFESLKELPKQTALQKTADKKEIEKLITALSSDERIMFNCYLAAVDMKQEQFIDLFASVTNGKDQFKQSLIPGIKGALMLNSQLGVNINSVNNTINNKKNNTLTQKDRDYLSEIKKMIQKMYINPLTKAAVEQAKN
jgi:hypothetical protein